MMPIDGRRASVAAACLISFLFGLFFVFVWSPLPWGWKGIDLYYEIALSVARGEPFPTMHLVWGYVYFLAFWYHWFGDHQWIPLCAQVVLNATIPLLLYHLVRIVMTDRVAVVTAVLAGVFSFNTVYASTQASDAVCTVLVVAAMLCLTLGDARQRWIYFALAGLVLGLAYQFRPNFVLFPPFVAAVYLLIRPRSRRTLGHLATLLAVFVMVAAPWVIRNYRWSGLFVPASTHGGVQLWFGTLQSGAYEDSWIYNPRAAFEYPPLDYTSVDDFPVIVTAHANACAASARRQVDLVYWTNRDRVARRLTTAPDPDGGVLRYSVPRQPAPTALYYFFESSAVLAGRQHTARTPGDGVNPPLMTVISRDHLGDLDVDHSVLDVFDIVRMLRHVYWHEPLPLAKQLDLDADGAVTDRDVRDAVAMLLHDRAPTRAPVHAPVRAPAAAPGGALAATAPDEVVAIEHDDAMVTVRLRDGSALSVPRHWSGLVTDLPLRTVGVGSMVALLVSRSRPFAQLGGGDEGSHASPDPCLTIDEIGVNRVPYRRLPHEMRRFTALALDNIRHDPGAYLEASAHRALRVFVIAGSSDTRTAYQFNRGALIFMIGRVASTIYLALFIAGLTIAIVKRMAVALLLMPIVFVPLTICFMLINARYSMTTQPFMFAFVAVALVTAADAWTPAWARRVLQARRWPAVER